MIYSTGIRAAVNEVYMGRTPEIQRVFNDWSAIRSTCVEKKRVPQAKDIGKIENELAKIFGFKSVYIGFQFDKTANAYTYPVTSSFGVDTDKLIRTTKKGGYSFDPKAGIVLYVVLTTGLYLNPDFTDEEVFALLLHEVGHSFVIRGSRMENIIMLDNMIRVIKLVTNAIVNIMNSKSPTTDIHNIAITQSNSYKSALISVSKGIRGNAFLRVVFGSGQLLKYALQLVLEPILYARSRVQLLGTFIPLKVGTIIMNCMWSIVGGNPLWSTEYLPDDFAATYGFGAALDSALSKIDNWDLMNKNRLRSKIPVIRGLNKFLDTVVKEYIECVDVHPSSKKRSYQVRKKLLWELDQNKDLDPRLKKDLKEQILQICKECSDIEDSMKVMDDNKDQAVIVMRQILKDTGGKYEAGDLVDKYLDFEKMNDDFEDGLID